MLNVGGTAYDDLILTPGSKIYFDLKYDGYNQDKSFTFKKTYTVQHTYTTTSTKSAFELWADAETNWTKESYAFDWAIPNGSGDTTHTVNKFTIPSQDEDDESFEFWLWKDTGATFAPPTTRWHCSWTTTERVAFFERGRITINLDMDLLPGILTFETDPKELNSDVYFETEQTFKIESGYHQGTEQHQTSSAPAIIKLNYGNCYSFANGVESISVRDDRFEQFLDIDTRPNINLLQGYARRESKNRLIFSSSFNENTKYNSLNEFNSSRGITKYMDMKYGSVQRVYSREDDLLVFQEDRVSKVLYGKGVISSPDGTGTLSQIEQVLGQDIPFTGEFGIGKSPESFASYENNVYFADPYRGAVLRLGQNGITPISSEGMKSYFKTTLYNNRNYFNVGGYDPKHNQYILTPGESGPKTEATPQTTCNSEMVVKVSKTSSHSYVWNLSDQIGTYTLNYTVTGGNADITIDYNSSQTTTTVSGTGTLTFSGNPNNDTNAVITVITNASASSDLSTVTLKNVCPPVETMNITVLVVNDGYEAGQNVINRFKHSGANVYNSNTDVFDSSGTTRFETFVGNMGSNNIPDNGDTVTLSSLRYPKVHSGDFNPCNDLGYWITSAASPTVADILTNANFTGSTTHAETTVQEENTLQFTFNRSNTNENLYLVFDYRDTLPVLVNDSVTGISNGGSSTVNVVTNDTIPSPYTLTIKTPPTNGTATIVSGSPTTSITYQHTAGSALVDSFQYEVSRGGTCVSIATVSTQALGITENTYIYIYFDASGSMDNTLTELRDLKDGSLKGVLQDLYATAGTASSGNSNTATNGSDAYDSHVTLVYEEDNNTATRWANEQTWAALSDLDVNDFLVNGHNDFPSDADNVVFLIFQDEASAVYHPSEPTSQCQTDIASLRSRMTTLNASNNNFYRGVLFQVDGSADFKTHVTNVFTSASPYTSTGGLSDFNTDTSGVLKPYLKLITDIEDSNNNDATAPHKPAPDQAERFDQWEYYYLYWVTKALDDLGYDSDGSLGWPIVKDD